MRLEVELPHVAQVIKYLFEDQGDLAPHPIKLDNLDNIDWLRVEKMLSQLTKEELETFAIGDQDDMVAISDKYGKEGKYAHKALDELFGMIGG
jgi:hypothetical protein